MKKNEVKILIVDDNPTNLKVLFEYLSIEQGYKIFVAKNGREALERALYALPDIILLDIMMPEVDGYEACTELKKNEATQNIPIIFLTAFADTDNKVKAFNAGAVDYIVKPFNQEEVFARIKTHLTIARQTKELEQANASKDKLFSIVSHDMRNKLFGVTGSIELLESYYHELSDQERQEQIKSMSDSAKQMYKLFENLFTWSSMQTGSIDVCTQKLNFAKIADDIIKLFKEDAKAKGIKLLTYVSDDSQVFDYP